MKTSRPLPQPGSLTRASVFATLPAHRMGFISRYLPILPLLAAAGGAVHAAPEPHVEAGPLAHEFTLTLGQGFRGEAGGPFFWQEVAPGTRGWAFCPLISFHHDAAVERTQYEFLYPLITYDLYGTQYRWQFMQLLSWSGGRSTDDSDTKRFTLFPFFFSQTSTDPAKSYRAFLPFYGTLKNRLFRDEIHFVALPLWVQTRKRDVVTDNYLAPFFHVRTGAAKGWQFWPLYGQESRAPITRTNAITDLPEVVPGHRRKFAVWPIWHVERLGIGTEDPVTNHMVLPLYAVRRSPSKDTTTVLWPFFTHTVDREKKFEEWGTPWPFIGWANGEGKHSRRFWPVYGKATNSELQSDFLLWPLYTHKVLRTQNLEREQTRSLFYVWIDVAERNRQTGAEYRRRSFWPLWYHWHDRDGRARLQILAPAEGAFPHNEGIQRGWSPIWSLYRSEKNPKAGAASQSLLWNLWRRDVKPEVTKTSFLFGIVKTEKTKEGRKWRWFSYGGKAGKETGPQK